MASETLSKATAGSLCTLLAPVPENPQDSDGDLSEDDDQIDDPDYQPTQAELSGDSSFESLDKEDTPLTSRSFTQLPLWTKFDSLAAATQTAEKHDDVLPVADVAVELSVFFD
ncbi:hypothetical protein E3U43_016276 [Larimichthys crocea]|uniref:Uncharacterized protein n=1 Tax=Larimichthys crocea TaxID=215358 RepID=A0ACD3QH15_LARCR|nr:hypothetical protein E3U43_016276 [Larimichthys crocea]